MINYEANELPCDLPHLMVSLLPPMTSRLKVFSAACSAALLVVYCTKAHCARGTRVRDLSTGQYMY